MSRGYELFLRFPGFNTRCVTFSYDDGDDSDLKMIEIFNRYGIKGTFNLNAGRIDGNPKKVQLEDLETAYAGHEVASHTLSHPHLYNLDLSGISYQLIYDREMLEEAVNKPVEGFAYPYGLREEFPDMVNCLKCCGIRYARTTNSTYSFGLPQDYLRWNPTCHHVTKKLPELIEAFFKPDDLEHPWRIEPRLFYIWGHSREFRDKWEDLEQICQTLGNKENIWYATNGEIIDYISAYRALRRSANGKMVYNPTDRDVYVSVNKENVLLEKGKITTLK